MGMSEKEYNLDKKSLSITNNSLTNDAKTLISTYNINLFYYYALSLFVNFQISSLLTF